MYYLFILGKRLALLFPRRFCYFFAYVVASLYYYLSRKDRRVVLFNLGPLIPERHERAKVAREVFRNFAYYLVDFFRYEKLDEEFLHNYVRFSGRENLERGLARKKGVIALSAHIGNYELGGAVVALLGYLFYAVALPHNDKRVNRFFDAQRERVGIKVIPTGVMIKRCFKALREGGIIALVGDRDFAEGKEANAVLFSVPAHLPRGPAFFALKTGASVVPCVFVREEKYYYRFIFDEPIVFEGEGITEETIVQEYSAILQKYIKAYPDQWYMFQKYWHLSAAE